MPEHLDPALVAVPIYVAAMFLEYGATKRREAAGSPLVGYERRDTIASLAVGFGSVFSVGVLGMGVEALATRLYGHRFFTFGDGPLTWLVGMLAWDFAYYWMHRAEHSVRILWATHVSHHSSRHYNFSTALRQPWGPVLLLLVYPPLALLGLKPWVLMTCGGLNLVYQFFVHTEVVKKLPAPFEWLFNTPSHHRVHHGSNPQYLDKNHGGILIIWDRIFGSFEPEVEPVVYGLVKNVESYHLWTIFIHEFQAVARDAASAKRWTDRARHVFANPGWKPKPESALTEPPNLT